MIGMNIALIDDDVVFLERLKSLSNTYCKNLFKGYQIDTFLDEKKLYEKKYDVYFLDIDLGTENGIEIAKCIKEIYADSIIIFISSKSYLIFNALKVQPFYFVRKSNVEEELAYAFFLLKDCYMQKEYYSFKYNYDDVNLLVDDILYVEVNDHLLTIVTKEKSFYIYKTIKELLNEIDSKNIVQINRKNCVNINHIISENKTTIKLDNGLILKVGKMYKKNLKQF